jgi:AraC-like DNA-binding protein
VPDREVRGYNCQVRLVVQSPSPSLSRFVRSISIVETLDEATRTLLPDTGMTLGLRYGGAAVELSRSDRHLPDASFSGLRRRARVMRTARGGGVVIARFREAGAAAFFAEPLYELFDTTLDLQDVMPASELERIRQQLAEAGDDAARIALVDAFLVQRRRRHRPDQLVESAVEALRRSHGALRIEALANELGLSRDRLEKRFRAAVGTTPKHHATILRLHRAIDLHRAGRALSDAAVEAGYFDQAHLTHDFAAFVGASPRRFFQSTEHC